MVIFDILNYFPETFPILKVALCGLVAFSLGILWYHPMVMGDTLDEVREPHEITFKPNIFTYIISFGLWMVMACVYSFLTAFLTPPTISALLGLSTFIWVGFVLPSIMLNGLYAGRKLMVMAVDSSYILASLYLFAVIHDVI